MMTVGSRRLCPSERVIWEFVVLQRWHFSPFWLLRLVHANCTHVSYQQSRLKGLRIEGVGDSMQIHQQDKQLVGIRSGASDMQKRHG